MLYGLYLSTAGAKAQSWRQDIIANNIANVSTTGFRQQFFAARQRLSPEGEFGKAPPSNPADPRRLGGGPHEYEAPTDFATEGTFEVTPRDPHNLAIHGDGFFRVQRGDEVFLTRNGNFAQDEAGFLTTADGRGQVLSTDGQPMQLDANAPFAVWQDGRIYQNNILVGQLALETPNDQAAVTREGANLFRYDGETTPANGRVEQFMLEGSNVNPIYEMTGLIEASRAFEMNIDMINLQNEGLGTFLQSVPRIS